MAWKDTLINLRDELADVRARRLERAEADEAQLRRIRREMSELSGSLGIGQLLADMNATLLEGRGEVETIASWEQEDDSGPETDEVIRLDEGEDDDEDALTNVLAWDEDGDREIAVEIVLDEEGISLQVNGVEIRPEREALEQALVEAFRDELEL